MGRENFVVSPDRLKALALQGTVMRGDGLGRRLGFPTANLKIPRSRIPPFGVYRVRVRGPGLEEGRLAVCNVGIRPTLGGAGRVRVEVHIPGYSGDLYGKSLAVSFLGRIRQEKKFPSLSALKAQIRRDVRFLTIKRGQKALDKRPQGS